MVLLAGGLAANPAWHEALHHHAEGPASADDHHHGGDASGAADEGSCAVCAFAHQQVDSGWASPVTGPVLGLWEWAGWPMPPVLLLESAWPEPSGRGPPVGA